MRIEEASGHEPRLLPAAGGTYALVLRLIAARRIRVGALGVLPARPGYYLYLGSALGPGGLRARLRRHVEGVGRLHWHVDYLRRYAEPVEVWWSKGSQRREHLWARTAYLVRGATSPLAGFGSSDCSCLAHLVYQSRAPSFRSFSRRIHRAAYDHPSLERSRL